MTVDQKVTLSKWRPHHIYCVPYLAGNFLNRGEKFNQIEQRIKMTVQSGVDTMIEIIEGADELCLACPLCRNNRCQSPNGDEGAVRKWDGIILKALGITYGEKRSAKDFRTLIEEKAPLGLCREKCPWQDVCSVFE